MAAVHAQHLNDPVVLSAVDEIEMLCTGLSRKIWQKIMLIPRGNGGVQGQTAVPARPPPLRQKSQPTPSSNMSVGSSWPSTPLIGRWNS